MGVARVISAVFGFRNSPTTLLVVLVYAVIFGLVLVTDELPNIPKDQRGLDLNEAYADLQQVRVLLPHTRVGPGLTAS